MICIHNKKIEERKVLGMILYQHLDNSYCSIMNATNEVKKIQKEIDFKKVDDVRMEYAYLESETFKQKLISVLSTSNKVQLIITIKKYKLHIKKLLNYLLDEFGINLYKNLEELGILKDQCMSINTTLLKHSDKMLLIEEYSVIEKIRKQIEKCSR